MSEHNRPDMAEWEAQINDLLDGELSEAQAGDLKAAAEQDTALAGAIIEAYQLQQAMSAIPMERAPDSLRRKLRRIPREQRREHRASWLQPQWIAAFASVPLAIALVVTQMGPRDPSPEEVAQATQDLKIAFAYLGKVRDRTRQEIGSQVTGGMNSAVTDNLLKTIDEQTTLQKERKT